MFLKIKGLIKNTLPFLIRHPLWKNNKLLPISHFLRLQLSFFFGKKILFLKWFENISLFIEKGDNGLTGNYYVGLHEFREMGFAIHLLKKEDVFVDVGANLGSYTLLASGICHCKTIAFEPIDKTFNKLSKNISINKLSNKVELRKKAILSEDELKKNKKLIFSVDRGCCNQVVNENYDGKKQYVSVSTLDKECQFLKPSLIKIDVESYEEKVLLGGLNILVQENLLALIVEGNSENVDRLLRSKGFVDFQYSPLKRKIRTQSNIEKLKLKRNWIWIRDSKIEFVKKRIKDAPIRTIFGAKI